MATLKSKLKGRKPPDTSVQKRDPVWAGPSGAGPNGGITFSLLSRFLVCRERFRLHVIEGLRPNDRFEPRMEYGNMWHACEEAHAKGDNANYGWEQELKRSYQQLCSKYPNDRSPIGEWVEKCAALFPVYVEHWAKHPEVVARTPLLQEQVFDVPYQLPSGRSVRLRGKWDSVDLVGKGKEAGIWIQENKTKSGIDSVKIGRQVAFDLQSMIYVVALEAWRFPNGVRKGMPDLLIAGGIPIAGVRYNVVRRSAHKSVESMLKKVNEDREDGRIGEWFSRWNVGITARDVKRFKEQTLSPILEQLSDWWEHISGTSSKESPFYCRPRGDDYFIHWRHPFGVWNVLDEGGASDLDAYLETGSEAGLRRVENLFPEL